MAASTDVVWDNHGCMPIRPGDVSFLPQIERYRDGGAHVVTLNVAWDGVPSDTAPKMLATFRRWFRERPDRYLLVETAEDIDRARSTGRLGVLFNIEGGVALAGQLEMVSLYYDLGVRWMAMAYNTANAIGGGCTDANDLGLTDFGRKVIDEMNHVGMIPCCSHTGHRTAIEVIERSAGPVIFSHSNANSVHPHQRNIGDELIRACAQRGGTIGLNGFGDFLGEGVASVENLVRHAQHVADLVGPDHVALGLDYCFDVAEVEAVIEADPERFPAGWNVDAGNALEPEALKVIPSALRQKGWSDADVAKIMGGNLRRVAARVWKT